MRPNSLVVRTYLLRGALLWIGTRLIASAVLVFGEMDPLQVSGSTRVGLIAFTLLVGLADVHRRHERVLLANLGVSRVVLLAFLSGPALFGEVALALIAAMRS